MPPDSIPLIRRATSADIADVVELRLALDAELGGSLEGERAAEHRRHIEAYLASHLADGSYRVWVAEAPDGELVATAGMVLLDRPPPARSRRSQEAFVFNVFTRPAWRRRGLARRLVDTAIAEARALHARRVILRTSEQGRPAYEQMGFTDSLDWLQLDLD